MRGARRRASENARCRENGRERRAARGREREERERTKIALRCAGTWLKANLFTLFTYKLLVGLFTYFPPSHRATERNALRCSRRRRPSFRFQMHFIESPSRLASRRETRNFSDGAVSVAFNSHVDGRLHLELRHRDVGRSQTLIFASRATTTSRNCLAAMLPCNSRGPRRYRAA